MITALSSRGGSTGFRFEYMVGLIGVFIALFISQRVALSTKFGKFKSASPDSMRQERLGIG